MATFRVERIPSQFATINKTFIYDSELSFKAKGIMTYLLSRPDDWEIYTSEIENHAQDKRDSVASGIKELVEKGYIERKQKRSGGKFGGYDYSVYEKPKGRIVTAEEKPQRFNRNGKSGNGKSNTTKNDITKNNITKNDNNSATNVASELENQLTKEFENWYNLYDKKKDRKAAFTKFKSARKKHSYEEIVKGTKEYLKTITDKQYQKYPKTFLNNESYLDDYSNDIKNNESSYLDKVLNKEDPFDEVL